MGVVKATKRVRKPKAMAQGPPWFVCTPLYEGPHAEFGEALDRWIVPLDRAAGDEIHVAVVGDPSIRGECYEKMMSDRLRMRTAKEEESFLHFAGRNSAEVHYRVREMGKVAERYSIDSSKLPCLAFRPWPMNGSVPILKINQEWIQTEDRIRTFLSLFEEWLKKKQWVNKVRAPMPVRELCSVLRSDIKNLEREIRVGMKRSCTKSRAKAEIEDLAMDLRVNNVTRVIVFKEKTFQFTQNEFAAMQFILQHGIIDGMAVPVPKDSLLAYLAEGRKSARKRREPNRRFKEIFRASGAVGPGKLLIESADRRSISVNI